MQMRNLSGPITLTPRGRARRAALPVVGRPPTVPEPGDRQHAREPEEADGNAHDPRILAAGVVHPDAQHDQSDGQEEGERRAGVAHGIQAARGASSHDMSSEGLERSSFFTRSISVAGSWFAAASAKMTNCPARMFRAC